MKLEVDKKRKKSLYLAVFLALAVIMIVGILSFVLAFFFWKQTLVAVIFGGVFIVSVVMLFVWLLYFSKVSELLSTQEIYLDEDNLIFYHAQKDGNEDGFGGMHFYTRTREVKAVKKHKLFLCIKGQFQQKAEGYKALEIQNPDEEKSKLEFFEEVDLLFFEDSQITKKSLLIPRIYDAKTEEKILEKIKI